MAFFVFPDLPADIAISIVRLVAKEGYESIGSLVLTGRYGRDLALSPDVLKEFLINPTLINQDKDERLFFRRCVAAKNPDPCYLEGIRILCQDGNPSRGLGTLSLGEPRSLHCKFAMGIFNFCMGRMNRALRLIREVEEAVDYDFQVMNMYGDQLIDYIGDIRIITEYGLVRDWSNRMYEAVPRCLNNPCLYDTRCPACYVFFLATRVRLLC